MSQIYGALHLASHDPAKSSYGFHPTFLRDGWDFVLDELSSWYNEYGIKNFLLHMPTGHFRLPGFFNILSGKMINLEAQVLGDVESFLITSNTEIVGFLDDFDNRFDKINPRLIIYLGSLTALDFMYKTNPTEWFSMIHAAVSPWLVSPYTDIVIDHSSTTEREEWHKLQVLETLRSYLKTFNKTLYLEASPKITDSHLSAHKSLCTESYYQKNKDKILPNIRWWRADSLDTNKTTANAVEFVKDCFYKNQDIVISMRPSVKELKKSIEFFSNLKDENAGFKNMR